MKGRKKERKEGGREEGRKEGRKKEKFELNSFLHKDLKIITRYMVFLMRNLEKKILLTKL